LDTLDPKRREVIEAWQKLVKNSRGVSYRISSTELQPSMVISSDTHFHSNDADQWVRVERYVRGEIQDLGGSTHPNIHIKSPNGKPLTLKASRETLRNETVNRLYKSAMLRLSAEYNVFTQELRKATLLEFIDYSANFVEDDSTKLTRRGQDAWREVSDATAWVEDIRGSLQ
jgi:hypothetical protein